MSGYALAFFRLVIGMAFAWSFWGKVRDIPSFVAAIERFRLLPKALHQPAAWAFLAGELGVVILLFFPGPFPLGRGLGVMAGFLLAILMLLAFSLALGAVLVRKISTSCNCFGSSEKPVSPWDLLRNAGLIVCALGGLALTLASPTALGWLENGLMAAAALVFVAVWVQVGEIVALFR